MGRNKSRIHCCVGGRNGYTYKVCTGRHVNDKMVGGLEDKVRAYFAANKPDGDRKRHCGSSGSTTVAIEFYLGGNAKDQLIDSFSVSSAGWNRDDLFNCLLKAQAAAEKVVAA